jgi:hypothetical protein
VRSAQQAADPAINGTKPALITRWAGLNSGLARIATVKKHAQVPFGPLR